MPTLPMLNLNPAAGHNAAHFVFYPGGFERWTIAVQAADAQRLRIEIVYGIPSAEYRAAYRRYILRPTKVPPPLPVEFAAVSIAFVRASNTIVDATTSGHCRLEQEGRIVQINQCRLEVLDDAVTVACDIDGTRVTLRTDVASHAPAELQQIGQQSSYTVMPIAGRADASIELQGNMITIAGEGWIEHTFGASQFEN